MTRMPGAFPTPPPPHPESDKFRKAILRCVPWAGPWSGIGYRAANPRRANATELLAGVGSQFTGGRWNPLGTFATVYLSREYHTALEEALVGNRRRGLPPWSAMPFVMTSVRVQLSLVLDLTAGRVRRSLGVSRERMIREPWWQIRDRGQESTTQALGRLARGAGIQALIVPSAAVRHGANLVVFPDHLIAHIDRLEVVNADLLPPPWPGP